MDLQKVPNSLWIAWEKQTRSTTLATEIGAELKQLTSELPRLARYIILGLRTVRLLLSKHYEVIFTQNPSIVLCLLMVWLKPLHKAKVVIDSHTPILKLGGVRKVCFEWITGVIFRKADLVIVTNTDLMDVLRRKYPEVHYHVLPDKIPNGFNFRKRTLAGKLNIMLVCSYAPDEPYIEAFKAVRQFDGSFLYVTGNKAMVSQAALDLKPDNVVLTGYLPDEDYFSLLNSVDIVMDLTDVENCMVCGAYEGLAAGKPMILSDKKVLVDYFDQGIVHTKNEAGHIIEAIKHAGASLERMRKEVSILRARRKIEWQEQWSGLLKTIRGLVSKTE